MRARQRARARDAMRRTTADSGVRGGSARAAHATNPPACGLPQRSSAYRGGTRADASRTRVVDRNHLRESGELHRGRPETSLKSKCKMPNARLQANC